MDNADRLAAIRSLLEAPSPAVLTFYRPDGSAVVSPVWFRVNGEAFEVVIAASDPKLAHLERDPRCVLVIFETAPPFRAVEVRADEARLSGEGVAEARLSIASRYLGPDRGRRFAERRGKHGVVLRLPTAPVRIWDLAAVLPPG